MSALVTDRDRLATMQACLEQGLMEPAVFELAVRALPLRRNFLVAAGLEQALQFLKSLSFSEAEFAWLRDHGGHSPQFLEYARTLRFNGDVDAMPEGTVFFAGEPILRISAALPLALLVESRLLNLVHFETSIASSAARLVIAAGGRRLIDFGLRQAHGAEAALLAARAAYIAGFDGTCTADASRRFGIPSFGTLGMRPADAGIATLAVLAHASPGRITLLIDTSAAATSAESLAVLTSALRRDADSRGGPQTDGDTGARAVALRGLLDATGLADLTIYASGDLDEEGIATLIDSGAPIDGFGLRGWLSSAGESGLVDAVYAMRHYGSSDDSSASDRAAPGNAWPGARNVLRRHGVDGLIECDLIVHEREIGEAQALLQPCMRAGKRVGRAPTLSESRAHHVSQVASLPAELRGLRHADRTVPVTTR